jgi:hypothetical protein
VFMNNIISEEYVDFKDFEQQCYDLGMGFARMVMTSVLEDIDGKLLKTRDRAEYRAKGVRPLTIKTLMGEVTVRRRLYKKRNEDGHTEHICLLDRIIGIDTVGKFSQGLIRRMSDLITDSSYRAAAGAISFLSGQSISHGGLWNAVQAVGARIGEADKRRAREAKLFEHKGTKCVKVLQEEFDGLWINMQGKDRPAKGSKLEMKVAAAYEGVRFKGRDKEGKALYGLVNPMYTAGFESAPEFFLKKEGRLGAVYDLSEIDMRLMNGDGGGWIKGFGESCGCESLFQLDRFHIERALIKSGLPKEERKTVTELIDKAKPGEALEYIKRLAESESDEDKKKRIGEAEKYLSNHRECLTPILKRGLSLPAPSEEADLFGSMGAMESTGCGGLALRMKKRRASFTKDGATHLAGFIFLKRSGKADETIFGLSEMKLPRTAEEIAGIILSAAKAPKKDGKGKEFLKKGGLPFAGAATTNGRRAVKNLASLRSLADLGFTQAGGF